MAVNSSPEFPYPGGTPGAEPPDPVAGRPGHFAWSRWVKQFVKNLNANLMAHIDAPDPHPQYLTQSEGDGRYAPFGGGAGVSDHGALTGLLDDDHPQYLTQDRGNALYAPAGSSGITDHGQLTGLLNDDHPQYLTPGRGDDRYMQIGTVTAPTRSELLITTGSLAAGGSKSRTSLLAVGYRLLQVATSRPARVRLYTSAARRDADASRPVGTDPSGNHGLLLEFVTTADMLAADLSPAVDGYNADDPLSDLTYWTVTNLDVVAGEVVVTLIYVVTEVLAPAAVKE